MLNSILVKPSLKLDLLDNHKKSVAIRTAKSLSIHSQNILASKPELKLLKQRL